MTSNKGAVKPTAWPFHPDGAEVSNKQNQVFSPLLFASMQALIVFMQTNDVKSAPANIGKLMAENGSSNRTLVDALVNSRIYRDYERAFSNLTGLPMALRPVETWQLPHHGKREENALCALMSQKSSSCAACLELQGRLCQQATTEPQTMRCALGLSESAVPVRMSDRLLGFLQIGQVFRKNPTAAQFKKVARQTEKWGIKTDRAALKRAYFSGKVVTPKEYASAIKLLTIFAEQLATLSNQVFIQNGNAELPAITKARAYIEEHQTEKLSLGQVAKVVNMNVFYFCKVFKKNAGINFTDFVSRLRIEKAKNLLLNPNLHVSEIAYEVGFQSVTHFNRKFQNIVGRSPTNYRIRLATI